MNRPNFVLIMSDQQLGEPIANTAVFPYAAMLLLGPAIVYSSVRRAGETPRTALGFSLVISALWYAKEFYRVTGVFSVGAAVVGHDSGGREIFYGYIALYRILFAAI